jgi:hypothetical protein
MFGLPKLPTLSRPTIPKLSVPKLSVPKMFSKSTAKAPATAKASAPAKKAAPAKAAIPEFSDENGTPLIDNGSLGPKMCLKPDYKIPVTDLEKMFEQTEDPKRMFGILQKKYKMSTDRKTAVPCHWRYRGEPVYACMVLEDNKRLLLCYAKGDLKKLGYASWRPFNIKDYMTAVNIIKPMLVPVKNNQRYSSLWFTI